MCGSRHLTAVVDVGNQMEFDLSEACSQHDMLNVTTIPLT